MLENRNVQLHKAPTSAKTGRTSMRLSKRTWSALEAIAQSRKLTVDQVVDTIEVPADATRSETVRDFVLAYFMDQVGAAA